LKLRDDLGPIVHRGPIRLFACIIFQTTIVLTTRDLDED
jgi:hypothetical protein